MVSRSCDSSREKKTFLSTWGMILHQTIYFFPLSSYKEVEFLISKNKTKNFVYTGLILQ